MPTRPFFVQPDGECVPLEGAWRVTRVRGDWYVLGNNSVVPCGSERAARSMLLELEARSDADWLAEEAITALDSTGYAEGPEAEAPEADESEPDEPGALQARALERTTRRLERRRDPAPR